MTRVSLWNRLCCTVANQASTDRNSDQAHWLPKQAHPTITGTILVSVDASDSYATEWLDSKWDPAQIEWPCMIEHIFVVVSLGPWSLGWVATANNLVLAGCGTAASHSWWGCWYRAGDMARAARAHLESLVAYGASHELNISWIGFLICIIPIFATFGSRFFQFLNL